ncbi:MAG: MBL fold metallo-hydrolase [Candidatus Latescibacteria bacterium]|nr:MBL fold metallo-hydrolase [Candidatus Latescibacterota bacterium]
MKICVLGSGSKGNCIYVESHGTAVLIDQGFSHKKIDERLESRGLDTSKIKALFITHEHDDHVRGVGITARKLDIPVYGTAGTLDAKRNLFNGDQELIPVESGIIVKVGSLELLPFSVSHDAVDPVQFCIHSGKKKTGIATDLGFVSTLVEQRLRESDIIIIESNHDVDMLKNGSYPWELKQRIMGRKGHLSNRNAADIIFNLTQYKSAKTILAHLSEENNTAELAEKAVRELFDRFDRRLLSLTVAAQDEATTIIEI